MFRVGVHSKLKYIYKLLIIRDNGRVLKVNVCVYLSHATLTSPYLILMFFSVCRLNPVLRYSCTPHRYHLYNMFSLKTRNSFYGIKGSWHIQHVEFKKNYCRDHEKLVIWKSISITSTPSGTLCNWNISISTRVLSKVLHLIKCYKWHVMSSKRW